MSPEKFTNRFSEVQRLCITAAIESNKLHDSAQTWNSRTGGGDTNTLRIVGLGLLGITALLILVSAQHLRQESEKRNGLRVLREMTPESLITNCGQPTSDEERAVVQNIAFVRTIEYKRVNFPYWVKLEFTRDTDRHWHLSQFASPAVGVSPSDDNAYIAIPQFPCMAK